MGSFFGQLLGQCWTQSWVNVGSIFEYLPIFDVDSKMFEYEATEDTAELRENVRTAITTNFRTKINDKKFDGGLLNIESFYKKDQIPLPLKYQHMQLIYWLLVSDETSSQMLVKKIAFVQEHFQDHLELNLSRLSPNDMFEICNLYQSFKAQVRV